MRGRQRRWSDEEFVEAVAKHTNFTDVLRELGLRPAGGNHRTMKSAAERLRVSTRHFTDDRRTRGLRRAREITRLTPDDVFCERSAANHATLRRYALRVLAPRSCGECGNTGIWNGSALTLQLDHRNGVYNDNRLENLRWLCPNCHSQTASFAGRGSARIAMPPTDRVASLTPRPQPARRVSGPTVAL